MAGNLSGIPNGVTAEAFAALVTDLNALATRVNQLTTLCAELKTDLSAHTHGGVTAGSANTSAGPTISAALTETAITLQTS